MRVLSTRTHGWLDYGIGVLLAILPTWLGFRGGLHAWLPTLLGFAVILYSLLTDYERAVLRLIPMRWHLALDGAGGVLLLALAASSAGAPRQWLALALLGLAELGAALLTRTKTEEGAGLVRAPVLSATGLSDVAMPAADGPRTTDGRPLPPPVPRTVEQVRRAIDSGATGDKVAMTDPAAAPLGSDAEAAGDGPDEEGLAIARRQGRDAHEGG